MCICHAFLYMPWVAPAYMIRFGAYRYIALPVLHLCSYSPGPCRSIYVRLVWRRYRFPSLRGNVSCDPGLFITAVIPRYVTLRCSMSSARLGVGHNRCPHCGGVERRSKTMKKPVFLVLLYHISIDFSSAERPHFSTVFGFCRKKFEKN